MTQDLSWWRYGGGAWRGLRCTDIEKCAVCEGKARADDLADMKSCDFTEEQITSLVGGCVPRTMVFDPLLLMLQSLQLLVPSLATTGACPTLTDKQAAAIPVIVPVAVPIVVPGSVPDEEAAGSVQQQPLPVAPSGLPPAGSLVLGAVIPELDRVLVDSSGTLPSMPGSGAQKIPTGKVLAAFKLAFNLMSDEVLFLQGSALLAQFQLPSAGYEPQGIHLSSSMPLWQLSQTWHTRGHMDQPA